MSENSEHDPVALGESTGIVSLEDIPLHSTNLLSLLDERGTIQYQSPSVERLCGFSQDDLVGTPCTECLHPDDRQAVFAAFKNVVSSDEFIVEAIEYRHLTADGTFLWVESVASSNPTPNGYYVINTRDISKQKQQETELLAANDRLEEFARIVSHDLRNPLAVAQGYLEIAEDDTPNEHHATVSTALARMETLIDSLLENARVEMQDPDVGPVDLTQLSETCWQNIVSDTATLRTDGDQLIYADLLSLTQLLENLFRNAIEHGRNNGVVTVGTLANGFYIEDDGSGIPVAERAEIFGAGYSTQSAGTGLGLAIVKRVVDSHGWRIRVTESHAGGARFEITGVDTVS